MVFDDRYGQSRITTIENTVRLQGDDIADLKKDREEMLKEWRELKLSLMGNKELGTKPVFTRIFEAIESLPCKENMKKLNEIAERQARQNGYNTGHDINQDERLWIKNVVLHYFRLKVLDKLIVGVFVILFLFVCGIGGASALYHLP